ncbi:MAG TPA: 6-phosphofructokinase [Verrucomicrobiota bacterium]|nr:6-phosphofructokinase [Verrucomicrobiota bacterium]
MGNLLVGQSGGPTAVINASVAGVILEAGKHPNQIEEIYGGLNGIFGILHENLIDLNEEKRRSIEELKHTPGAALGTCRYKVQFKKNPEQAARDMDRLFEVFKAHNIRYFFYAGGNDSQDTNNKVHQEAIKRGYPLRCIGVPKTIDNDLPHTDHTPGFGSAAKYNATTVMEVAQDVASMATDDGSCCIIEVMGRAAGWLAAATVLAKRKPTDGPHIILLPEIPLDEEKFLAKVKETVDQLGYCIVVAGEGMKDGEGNELGADKSRLDSFGHPVLSGAAEALGELVHGKLDLKTRTVKLGYAQRAAAHFASQQDVDEAVACGEAAVRAAVEGKSGLMVTIKRKSDVPYEFATGLHPLGDIALVERTIPRDWINEDGWLPNETFIKYAAPLVAGRLDLPTDDGLPKFAELSRLPVEKVLEPRSS